jgi:peptide/nickel transport system substrate-binding protein
LLDGVFYQVFEDVGTAVTAMQSGAIDAVQQFSVIGGDALLNSSSFTVLTPPAATRRQIWMWCSDDSQFGDKRVRQALALCFNRQSMVDTLFQGRAEIANDHPVADFNPFFDPDAVPQREFDPEQARQLLTDAGFPDGVTATLHAGQNQEIPDLAAIIAADAQAGGFTLQVQVESQETFYGAQWCPAEPADPPCSGASELGIVDYGHRATPDVYLNAALSTNGIWNSSQYMSPEFDAAFTAYQEAVGLDEQTAACTTIEEILNDEVPVIVPYFYNYISGFTKQYTGVRVSALGQLFLDQAAKV